MKNAKSIFSVAESTYTQRLRCQKPWRGGVGLWKIHSVWAVRVGWGRACRSPIFFSVCLRAHARLLPSKQFAAQ